MRYRIILANYLAFACLAAFSPRPALAQVPTVEQLVTRIAELEKRIAELEQRLHAVEGLQTPTRPENRAVRGNARDLGNWRQLQLGMTMNQVSELLGQPERVSAIITISWSYPNRGSVVFNAQSKTVMGWEEPSR
jgi:hypothetical protein